MIRRLLPLLVLALVVAAAARASAPPVGPLPKGPTTTIHVPPGLLFAVALPKPPRGYFWRGARRSDSTVAKPLQEAEMSGDIVVTYRAGHRGHTVVVYALTRGEGPKAVQARFFDITVG